MLYLLQKLYPLFQNSKNPEDIHPLLGEILLILSADTEKDYLHALDLFSSCRQILELCNEICRQADWNFSLDLAIAADAGRAENSSFRDPARFRTPLPGQESMKKEPPVSATPWKRESIKIP